MLAALDPADLSTASKALRNLDVPTPLGWGTGDAAFGVKWGRRGCPGRALAAAGLTGLVPRWQQSLRKAHP